MRRPEPSRRDLCALAAALTLGALTTGCDATSRRLRPPVSTRELPTVGTLGAMTLSRALRSRRSVRAFTGQQLGDAEVGELLWAAQGVTHGAGLRTSPSAGALYPLEVYAVSGSTVMHYLPTGHRVEQWTAAMAWPDLVAATTSEDAVRAAPVAFVVAAVASRTEGKYGDDAERYVTLEAGHATQNLLLQAAALGLGGVPLGAFDRHAVGDALSMARDESAYYVVPVGHPAGTG
jgi:SagB-type dehydrogenase family enzyme